MEVKNFAHEQGLKKLPPDKRDFSHHRVFGTMDPIDLPTGDFMIGAPLEIKNQGQSDLCTAFAACAISEFQEGVKLSPEFHFAKAKELLGDFRTYGCDLRTACQVSVKFGDIEEYMSPMKLGSNQRDEVANWANYPLSLDNDARAHAKRSFFTVDGPNDLFDNIRSFLWRQMEMPPEARSGILTGAEWRPSWVTAQGGVIPLNYEDSGPGHAFALVGQKVINSVPYIVAQLSNGDQFGDKGFYYFPREVVNLQFTFGTFGFADMDKDTAQVLHSWNLSDAWMWFAKIIVAIKKILNL